MRKRREVLSVLVSVIKAFGTDIGYDEYDALEFPDKPSRSTLRRHFGSFEEAKAEAFKKLPRRPVVDATEHELDWSGERVVRFGIVSDTHFGSKYQQLGHLHDCYQWFSEQGITTVFHCGDVTEGLKMRAGHEAELFLHSGDDMVDYVVENYPCTGGIQTHFITGNHDYSLVKHVGIDIGKLIGRMRPDMHYLGQLNALVHVTPECLLELNHPLDGASYALSYSAQKYLDAIQGGTKPNILCIGHHHKLFYMPLYRNVHTFEVGTFQAQTPWMRGKRLAAHVGAWLLEVIVESDGTILDLGIRSRPYYRMRERDYSIGGGG